MPTPFRVLILTSLPVAAPLVESIQAVSPGIQVQALAAKSPNEIDPRAWDNVEVLYTTGLAPSAEQAPALRWIQASHAGVEHVLHASPELFNHVALTTTSGIHAPNMAEYVLMAMLAHAHHLPGMLQAQADAQWPADRLTRFAARQLRAATLGIVGYGSIGREVARVACAFGMRVLACKRDVSRREDTGWALPGTGDRTGILPERYFSLAELPAMLAESDYVLLAVPLTAATRHVIDAQALQAMKRGAFLINIARGGVIDEPALEEALRSGALGGAALDVFEREPLPADHPLWHLPNVILTPHMSGFMLIYNDLAMTLFAENLRRYLGGEPLFNLVNPQLGY